MKPKKMLNNNEDKSINDLLGTIPEEKLNYNSYLVQRVSELCNIPISKFEIEDYRILINQGIALKYIIPPAIKILSDNLFAEGDYYEGDLLKSVLTVDESFWKENPIHLEALKSICQQKFDRIRDLDLSDEIKETLMTLGKNLLDIKLK